MALMRSEPRTSLARIAPGTADPGQDSVAELAGRLAQESVALAVVEARRLGAEVRESGGQAARVAAAAFLVAVLIGVALSALAVAAILYLGRMWQDYAAGALATGVLLLLVALAAAWRLVAAIKRPTRGESHEPQERSASHGT
jgi:uncharacterized membrane protein YqjE